ncbi:MAG: hypothetical protein ACI81R_001267 [Bradymonadia bacterium]
MGKARYRILGLAAVLATATACSDTSEEVVTLPDGASLQNDVVDLQTRASAATVELEYVASYDPTTGIFDIAVVNTSIETPMLSMLNGEVLRDAEQGLFCPIRATPGGASGTFGISTSNIGEDPGACGFVAGFPYSTLGVFCADITLVNNFGVGVDEVYAEITEMTPSVGHNGYAFPDGNGVNPASITAGNGAPSNALGLWGYGDIADAGTSTSQWVFEYTPEPFTFSGRVVGAVPEICGNGFDDNCDGIVDSDEGNGANCGVEAVDSCLDGTDCVSFNCDTGVCASPLPEDCLAAGDEDGNGLEGCADAACAGLVDDLGATCPSCGVTITDFGAYTANVIGAGDNTSIRAGANTEDVAWFFTPALTGDYVIDTCGTPFDTTLGVYDGDCAAQATELAFNDDSFAACGSSASAVTISLTAGTEYMIAAEPYSSGTAIGAGDVSLNIGYDGPETDFGVGACVDGIDNNFDGALDCDEEACFGVDGCAFPLGTCQSPASAVNGANAVTPEDVNSFHSTLIGGNCSGFSSIGAGDEFVFSYTATNDGTITIDTIGSTWDTVLYARHAAGLSDQATCEDQALEIECNDDGAGFPLSIFDLDVVNGETYFLFIDAYGAIDPSDVGVININANEAYLNACADGLDNDGDGNADCADIACSSLPVCATATLPYAENFNTDNGGWSTDEQGSNDVPWEHGDPTLSGAFDGDAWATGLAVNYNNSSLGFLRSPTFDVSGVSNDTLIVTFQIDYDAEAGWDGAQLVANIDGTDVVVVDGLSNWYNDALGAAPVWSGDSAGYLLAEAEIVLPPGAATLYLNFLFVADGSGDDVGVVIDDVTLDEKLVEDCTNGIDDNADGAIDCAESFCLTNEPTCTETGAECAGGVDDDLDGAIDCLDSDCTLDPLCVETLPYFEDFEAASTWQVFFGTNWVEGAPAGATINAAFSGANSVHFTSYSANDIATIQSPIIDTSSLTVDAAITWNWWSNLEGATTAWDIVQLQYSIDGAAFAPIVDGLANWNPSATGGIVGFGNPRVGYEFSAATLTGTVGSSTLQIQAVFNADGSGQVEGFSFDDVTVLEPLAEVCNDGTDEDFDGAIDCADSDCWTAGGLCAEVCDGAGNDEDGDTDVDCADADCAADPLCIVATTPYFEDFETNSGGYAGTEDWEYGTPAGAVFTTANSGANAWGTTHAGQAGSLDAILTSPQFDFTANAGNDLYLEFFYQFDTAGFTTEVRVDSSIDGGTTWSNIDTGLTDWGNSTATFGGDCGDDGGDTGTRCWEDNSVIGWTLARADISALAGEADARFRVYYDGSNNGAGREGFVIDDITIGETPIEAGSCGDGTDNDFDGALDCIDTDCNGDPICVEICYGGNDEDADALTDCADTVDCPSTDSSCLTTIDAFPYTADFALGTEGWTSNGQWEFGTEAGGDLASVVALGQGWVTNIGGEYTVNSDSFDSSLTSANFDFSGEVADAVATFSYVYATENCCDDVLIEYSIDSGATYANLATLGGDGFGALQVSTFTLTGSAAVADVTFRIFVDSDGSVQDQGFALQGLTVGVPVPETAALECGDALDNDFDTLVDCLDDDCWFAGTTCTEVCDAGGFDEDGDAAIDCADTDCHGVAFGCAEDCSTALDEDGNTFAGCADTANCAFDPACFSAGFPYTQDFESGAAGWVGTEDFELGTPAGTLFNTANSGTNAWVTTLAGNHNSVDSLLNSPRFDFSGVTALNKPMLVINYQFDSANFNAEARFDTSIDGGVTWQVLNAGLVGWGNSIATFSGDCGDGTTNGDLCWEDGDVIGWTEASADLTAFAGESDLRLRVYFDGSGTAEEGFALDDVSVVSAPAEVCNDGTDEDFDGAIDCIDSDCAADPACVASPVPYAVDFDFGAQGWGSVGTFAFELGAPAQATLSAANTGTDVWMTDLDADYSASAYYVLQSPALDLTGLLDGVLNFSHIASVDDGWDEFGIFVSIDAGTTWASVPAGTDTGSACIATSYSGNMSACWEDDILAWTANSVVLPGTAGVADVRVRFEFGTDGSVQGEGWAIDDVSVTESAAEICNSGVDEDFDGAIDCADSDCLGDAACPDPTNLISFNFVTAGSWAGEKEYTVVDSIGTVVLATVFGVVDTPNLNLADGCYVLQLVDAYGDGWDGHEMDVIDGTSAVLLDNVTVAGASANFDFGVNTAVCP